MTVENTIQDTGAPESYSSEDLATVSQASSDVQEPGQQVPGTEIESPPSTSDAPPGASPTDARLAEAEKALVEERSRLADIQRTNEELQRRETDAQFQTQVQAEVQKRQADLVQQNWGEVEARQEAQSYGRAVMAERQVSTLSQQLEDAGRLVRAMQLEKETGTPAADLIPYATPNEMERAARSRSADSKKITDMQVQIDKLTQGAVPVGQQYDSNSSTGGMSDNQLIAAYANGDPVDINKVVDAMGRLS